MDLLRKVRRGRLTRVLVPLLAAAAIPATAAQAETITQMKVPYPGPPLDPCTGQPVVWDGDLHLLITLTETDDRVLSSAQTNTQGVTGQDLLGRRYSVQQGVTNTFHIGDPPVTLKATERHLVKGPTQADDFYFTVTFVISTNGQGIPTVFVDRENPTCK